LNEHKIATLTLKDADTKNCTFKPGLLCLFQKIG